MNAANQTARIEAVNEQTFEQEVLASQVPVLVDFGAQWCAPCRAIAPTVEALATEYAGRAKVVTVDTGESPQLSTDYGVQSIPTLLVFKAGQVVQRFVGLTGKKELAAALDQAL